MTLPAQEVMLSLDAAAISRLMPMHVSLSPDGIILTAGPTLERIAGRALAGLPFETQFLLRRPAESHGSRDIARLAGQPLLVALVAEQQTVLRGLAVPTAGGRMLVNFSLGINLPEVVRAHKLSQTDFAATDLAVEMLYLIEVKALVMAELHGLNARLQSARSVAEHQAQTDPLTGLRNRRAMEAQLAALCIGSRPFGVVHLDLDYFKQVNDTLGHAAGDHVLQVVATILTSETRQGDLVARVGGDEFVILLPGLTDAAPIDTIAERIIRRLDQPIYFAGQGCQVSASVGFVMSKAYPRPEPDRLLNDADAALYASKRGGRGRVTNFGAIPPGPAAGRKPS